MPAAALYQISESSDPKVEALKLLGDMKDVVVAGARVLLWTYIRPGKTKSGIILTDKEKKEDVYQGVVGLVLKKGPAAFKDDDSHQFHGLNVEDGAWVVFKPGNTQRVQINGVDCRIIEDTMIDMVIENPELVTHRQ